jgi:hypothetical protein
MAVSTVDGIKYGFQMMLYFTVLVVIGVVIFSIGGGMIASAESGYDTNIGQMIFGAVVSLGGVLTIYAGSMGALYKVIADAVEEGNRSTA